MQEIFNLQEKKKELEAEEEKFALELKELQEAVEPLKAELKEKENAKSEVVKKNRWVPFTS